MTWLKWGQRKNPEKSQDETASAVEKPDPVPVSVPEVTATEPVEIFEPTPEPSPLLPRKTHRRILPVDVEVFKLGTLQQAVQIYQHLKDKGFTFHDLVEYVDYATKFQTQVADIILTTPKTRSNVVETPQVRPLTRQEKKRFKGGHRRR